MDWDRADRRARITEWRSSHALAVEEAINAAVTELRAALESELRQAGWYDGLIGQQAFLNDRLAHRIRDTAEPLAARLLDRARLELAALVGETPAMAAASAAAIAGSQNYWTAAQLGAGVLGAAAAATATRTLAVSTVATWFGLGAATVVSWPVVAAGGAVTIVGLAASGRASWRHAEAQLREKGNAMIETTLLADEAYPPSVRSQLLTALATAATRVRAAA